MFKAGKIWGKTELIHANGVLEFHRIEFKAGFKCSEHKHKYKWNGFFVESGKMIVRVWQDADQQGLVDETMYGPGTLNENMTRRSIYFFIKRSKLVPIMQLFDWPDSLTSMGKRSVTTTPSQALSFINDPNIRNMAKAFAKRLKESENPVKLSYRIAYGREPTNFEQTNGINFLKHQTASYSGNKDRALIDYCGAIMSANEFIYIE